MAALGDQLRVERERRGVSLDALSSQTKVNPRYLEALERGAFHELPGGVFRRGIFRSYVGSLGLIEGDWLGRFEESLAENARSRGESSVANDEAWTTFAINVKRSRVERKQSHAVRWLGVFGLSLLLVAALWLVWHFELQSLTVR